MPSPAVKPSEAKSPSPDVDSETVRAVIRARRLRSRFFSEELFADPAWDMRLSDASRHFRELKDHALASVGGSRWGAAPGTREGAS